MKTKMFFRFVCVVLCIALCGGFVLSSLLNKDTNVAIADFNVRDIKVDNTTYLDQTLNMLSKFNNYETEISEKGLSFSGEMKASIGELLGFDYLADSNDEVKKKYETKYDFETGEFYLQITYYNENGIINVINEVVEPVLDEELDDVYIIYEGTKIYFSETFNAESVEDCIAATATVGVAAVAVVGLIIITVVANDPTLKTQTTTMVTTVVETVKEAVKGIFSWLISWVTKTITKTVTTTTTTTIATPSVTINNVKYQTKEVSKADLQKYPQGTYYIAFADPSNGKMYLSTVTITKEIAAGIMNVSVGVNCIGDKNKIMITSIYTVVRTHIELVMDIVGYNPRTPKGYPEVDANKSGYYYHYHSLGTTGLSHEKTPHAFFGLPV